MLSSCVTPAFMNALETMALTEKQQEKVQVFENNLVRRIMGADKRRVNELRKDVGKYIIKNVMRIWLTWGGHMKHWQTLDVQKVEWKKGRGRPRLRR